MSACRECARRRTTVNRDKAELARLAHIATAEVARNGFTTRKTAIDVAKAHIVGSRAVLAAHEAECQAAA